MPELLEQVLQEAEGFVSVSDIRKGPGYAKKLAEAIALIHNTAGHPAHRHAFLIQEAMTTSDFPYLFGDVLDRRVMKTYTAVPPVWKAIGKKQVVNRIAPQVGNYAFAMSGGNERLERVGEKGEYLPSSRGENRYPMYVYKYGKQFDISWESLINDDLNALGDTPERFAEASLNMEHFRFVSTFADDDGTHGDNGAGELYDKATDGEINGSVNLLTLANLALGYQAMASFLDEVGNPIMNKPTTLYVPPALELTAREILTSTQKFYTQSGDTDIAATAYPVTSVIPQLGLNLVVDPWLPVVDATNGDTAWYLFADPNRIAAVQYGYLRGHERPEIVMKASDKVSIGGAPISPFSGDFATDNVFYRVRQCFGTSKMDWRATYAGGLVN